MREIAAVVHVSRSSVSRWVRDVDLSEEQHAALRGRNPIYNAQRRGNAVWSARRRAERERCQLEGRATARRGESLHAAGCMLSRYSKRKRTNTLPYGTCRIIVHDTAILQHIYGAIQEYAGFERPEWLR